jgi:hypothetical protein
MATSRDQRSAVDSGLPGSATPDPLFAKVAELRAAHLSGGGELADRTRDSYASDAARVANAGGDPMALAGTAASFRKLRAACLWKAREDLRECLIRADRARKNAPDPQSGMQEARRIYAEQLLDIERRLSFLMAARFDPARVGRRNKTHKQRHKLGRLPDDWLAQVHRRTRGGIYGEVVALGILIPLRPEEVANRVRVKLDASGALLFEVQGSKVREYGSGVAAHVEGIGQPVRWLTLSAVDPARQEVFDWLRERVRASGGKLTIGTGISARGLSSAFRALSRRLFAGYKSPPSFYALRHAACAELKAAGLDSQAVAQGMGHASELSQKAYGTWSQGSGGYAVETAAAKPVRSPKTAPTPRAMTMPLVKHLSASGKSKRL